MSELFCPFSCFGLKPQVNLDIQELDDIYYALQKSVHPDRYAGKTMDEKEEAARLSATVNEAYRILRHPVTRLRAFLEAHGQTVAAEENISSNPELILKVFELQEELEKLETPDERLELQEKIKKMMVCELEHFETLVATRQFDVAVSRFHWITYLDRIASSIKSAPFL